MSKPRLTKAESRMIEKLPLVLRNLKTLELLDAKQEASRAARRKL